MWTSPVACNAVEDMGRVAAAEPDHIRHVAEVLRFPMVEAQEKHMLTKRWRKRGRQVEVRAFRKIEDVVKHRVGIMHSTAPLRRLIAGISVNYREI